MSTSSHHKTSPEDRISLQQKSAYAVGMLVNNLQAAALPAMVVILNLGLGMDVLWVGLIGAIPRIFDAISDPMLGYISDNTRTRWGRRRPFIFTGAILAGILFALMWQLPSGYVDIIAKTPVKQHQTLAPEQKAAEFNNAGGAVLDYGAELRSDAEFIFYGPEQFALNQDVATNLDGFPEVEINVAIPEVQGFRAVFNEASSAAVSLDDGETAGGGDDESYFIDLRRQDSEDGKGNLYKFQLADLQRSDSHGNQSGNQVLDIQDMDNISIQLSGLAGSGTAVVHSLKLRKSHEFFVHYFRVFLAMSILFFLAYTVFATPFVAFGYEMTSDYHERTRLHAFANTVGQLAWLGVPWFYAIMASSLFRDTVHGARTLAIVVGVVVALLGIIPAIFLKERQTLPPAENSGKGFVENMAEFFKGIVLTFKCKPFVKLCGATFLVFNGFQLGMSFSIYVMIYYLFGGNDGDAGQLMGWFGMLVSISTLLVIPLTGWIATKIGKRKTFLITISLSIIGYSFKWIGYNPDYPYWLLYAAPLVAFGTGSLFTLMGSMISDVCDFDELGTHQRREGVFGAIYWWMVKVGMALAGLLTGILLKVSGFDVALGAAQSEETLFLIRVFDVGIPIVTSLAALWIIATYKLTETKVYDIRTQLEDRRGKVASADASHD
jgi:GPH family glycoside/pentoside/hexuronide:cation symporter